MNNKKQIIQVVVIIAAFAGSFLVLYNNGLFGGGGSSTAGTATQVDQTLEPILPYGSKLIFEPAINPKLFDYNQLTLPKVSQSEIGQQVNTLIKPIPVPEE